MGRQERKREKAFGDHSFRNYLIIIPTILVLITFFTYSQSPDNGFTNWDDPGYVTGNPSIRHITPGAIAGFFSHPSASNYHPLTMISLSIDYALTKKDPNATNEGLSINARVFHITSLVLHLLNVILVFFFIYILSGKRIIVPTVAGFLFAVHPMHVESIAWISERKDVLYTFFFLAGLICYLVYTRKKDITWYFLTVLCFLLSLLSKPAAVVFPLVLFSVDYFMGKKQTTRSVVEKSVLLVLSVIFGIVTLLIQMKGSMTIYTYFTFFQRILFALYGLFMYVLKLVIPINLSAYYPYPLPGMTGQLPLLYYLIPLGMIILGGLVIFSAKYTKVISFGFLFFVICIVLVLQIIPVGNAIFADRYFYVPSIGLFFIVGWYTDYLALKKTRMGRNLKYAVLSVLAIYCCVLVKLSYDRVQVWKNTETLWSDVIQKYPDGKLAYMNRGNYYASQHLTDKALKDYAMLVQLQSQNPKVYSNIGNIYVMRGEPEKALNAYTYSLSIDSASSAIWLNRGLTFIRVGRFKDAAGDFEKRKS